MNSGFCAEPPKDSMHLFRSTTPGESDLPWTGIGIYLILSVTWYNDQRVCVSLHFNRVIRVVFPF